MTVNLVPPTDLAPSLPSRIVTVNVVDAQEGDWAHDLTVTFTLIGDIHVAADRLIVSARPLHLHLVEGRGRVRLPVWTSVTGQWAILVEKSWAPYGYLIRVPAGIGEVDLSQINPIAEVPAGMNPSFFLTNASLTVVEGSAWAGMVTVDGGTANFQLTVPPGGVAWWRGLIPPGTDPDTMLDASWAGAYGVRTDTPHRPVARLGILEVIPMHNGTTLQRFTAYPISEVWIRTFTAEGIPGEWIAQTPPDDDDLVRVDATGAGGLQERFANGALGWKTDTGVVDAELGTTLPDAPTVHALAKAGMLRGTPAVGSNVGISIRSEGGTRSTVLETAATYDPVTGVVGPSLNAAIASGFVPASLHITGPALARLVPTGTYVLHAQPDGVHLIEGERNA